MFRLIGQFTPVLALYDSFGVDVPLNFDITHSLILIFKVCFVFTPSISGLVFVLAISLFLDILSGLVL